MLNFEVNDCEIVEDVHQTKHWLRLLLHKAVYMSLNKKNHSKLRPNYLFFRRKTHRNKPLRKQEVNIRLQHHNVDTRGRQTKSK